ncbi:MAG: GAK system CofD-like protein [Pseudomonadota bacterium]
MPPPVSVTRQFDPSDDLRIASARATPGFGPRLLFFSGGTALNEVSRSLKSYTQNSIHLITPFDSGGSSQVLRKAFDMPAVGDLRSRLMALADETVLGQPDIFALFSYRFPKDGPAKAVEAEYRTLLTAAHPLMRAISNPMRRLILTQLEAFEARRPKEFDLHGASVGNLILAGGYFANGSALEPAVFLMSKMVEVLGTVRAVVDDNLQIGADFADGTRIIGQARLTGKETAPLSQPIARLFLARGRKEIAPEDVPLPKRNRRLIEAADLICFPPGSLYSSVIANLLPDGVAQAVAARQVPKVYVPSLGADPECVGMALPDQVEALLGALGRGTGTPEARESLLSLVLCDRAAVSDALARKTERQTGVAVERVTGLARKTGDSYRPDRLCEALISMC